MPKRSRNADAPATFKKTMADLEKEINRIFVGDCKLDACVDMFLIELRKILRDFPGWACPTNLRSVAVKENENHRRDELVRELEENVNRLLPGVFPSSSDLLEHERMVGRLQSRWHYLRHEMEFMYYDFNEDSLDDDPEDGPEKELADRLDDSAKGNADARNKRQGDIDRFNQYLTEFANKHQSIRIADIVQESELQPASETPSLIGTALNEIYRNIKDSIKSEAAAASFVCGGSIPFQEGSTPEVNIFWSTSQDSHARKLTLPLSNNSTDSNIETLQRLVRDCSPASFGRGQQDVIDPEYRKAGKLDASQFASSFELSTYGIIPSVEAILLPSIKAKNKSNIEFRRLHAELYKLNVYSGPSGLFQKHVDTPRASNQIGSLVVCLPSPFKGGDLIVRHGGKEVNFDWSVRSASAIQWAAFYSDCEHEIKTISDGERITITYNLYVTETAGISSTFHTGVDPKSLPLYSFIERLLQQPAFMMQGGILGICCSHAYPHTSSTVERLFPQSLKGSDLTLYSIFQSLGIETDVRPILDSVEDVDDNQCRESEASRLHQEYLRDGGALRIQYEKLPFGVKLDKTDVDRRWKSLLATRQPIGLGKTRRFAQENGLELTGWNDHTIKSRRVGHKLHSYSVTDRGQEEDMNEVADDVWPNTSVPSITWINEPVHEEMAFSYIAYGNESSVGTVYSHAAILAVIPPFDERGDIISS